MKFAVRNPLHPERSLELEGLVDTGAHFTQVPRNLLDQIGVSPCGTRQVQYADGTIVAKPFATAEVLIQERFTPTLVLCGEATDLILIGAFTLEGLNLGVDPVRKALIPVIPPRI